MKHTCILFLLMSMSAIVNAQTTKILDVPYKTQPNNYSCQSTCLKMMSMYFEMEDTETKSIETIYNEINVGNSRPVPQKNNWINLAWWLNKHSENPLFSIKKTQSEADAIEYIVKCINDNSPVIISTSNFNTSGHLVLIVGYLNYIPNQSNPDFKLICHDPYGQFFPQLHSDLYGPNRYDFGMSLPDGNENGVGKGVEITPNKFKLYRDTLQQVDYFIMIGKPN